VSPADKEAARRTALGTLSRPAPVERALRINALATVAGVADLAALLQHDAAPDYLVLPKTGSAADLILLDALLTEAGKPTRLVGLIETAAALLEIGAIAKATPRLIALLFGAADMAADLGVAPEWDPLAYARGAVVAGCAAGGVFAIDTPFFSPRDPDGLARETARAIGFGFRAKAAIHPSQVGPINAAFIPSAEEIDRARRILAENAQGVGVVDGMMVDEAIARKARGILRAAGQAVEEGSPGLRK
jgi:(S)-citramalyl-CoA lyase